MAIDLFSTRTLSAAIEQMYPATGFFRQTFFGNEQLSLTEYVDVDIRTGGRLMAAFGKPELEAKIVEKRGFTTNSYKPPTIKMKKVCTAYDILQRQFGQHVYEGSMSPEQVAQQRLGYELQELIDMVERRLEWMAANALDTGSYVVAGDGVNETIDFGLPGTHRYTLGTLWSNTSAKPLEDLRDACRLIRKDSGLRPNIAIMGEDVIQPFLDRVAVELDTRRIDLGTLDPSSLPNGAVYWGYLKEVGLDVYTYDEYYDDGTGTIVEMMPKDRVFIGSSAAQNITHYGAIADLEVMSSVRYYPKTWMSPDPSAMFIMVQSRPLVALHQPTGFVSLEAI